MASARARTPGALLLKGRMIPTRTGVVSGATLGSVRNCGWLAVKGWVAGGPEGTGGAGGGAGGVVVQPARAAIATSPVMAQSRRIKRDANDAAPRFIGFGPFANTPSFSRCGKSASACARPL